MNKGIAITRDPHWQQKIHGNRHLAALGIAALALAVYLPALTNGFVNFDDNLYVTDNEIVLRGLSRESAAWALGSVELGNWHPLTWLSHMLDVTLFGRAASGHHLTSVLLHALNSALVFSLLKTLTGAVPGAALAAALFAVHPLHVESVVWVAERKDVLSATFFLAALLLYRWYAARRNAGRYLLVALAMSLGLTAKATPITLPLVLLIVDWWPLGRFGPAGKKARIHQEARRAARLIAEKVPLLVLSVAAAVLAVRSQGSGILWDRPLRDRLANAILACVAYVTKTIWPVNLTFYYPLPEHPPGPAVVILTLAVLVGAAIFAVRNRRRRPWLVAGGLWFLVTLLPVAGLIQVGGQSMADRYVYLPLAGLFLAVSWEAAQFLRPRGAARAAVAAFLLACLSVATILQERTWRDSETLMRRALAVTSRNDVAHNNLGEILLERGDVAGAIGEFRKVLEIDPRDALAHFNLGLTFSRLGDHQAAAMHYEEGLRTELDPRALEGLGDALRHLGRQADAEARFCEAAALRAKRGGGSKLPDPGRP